MDGRRLMVDDNRAWPDAPLPEDTEIVGQVVCLERGVERAPAGPDGAPARASLRDRLPERGELPVLGNLPDARLGHKDQHVTLGHGAISEALQGLTVLALAA